MKTRNHNLAIDHTTATIKGMTWAALGYLLIYVGAGSLEIRIQKLWMQVLYLVVVCFLAIGSRVFYKTDHVFVKLPREGKVKILTILFCIGILFLYLLIGRPENWIQVFNSNIEVIIASVCVALAAGIGEEFLCRVLLFNLFIKLFENKKHLLLWASLCSSILFGLFHLINLTHGAALNATLQQVFYAAATGLAFSYVHIFTNLIWPSIILHFLLDLEPQISTMNTQASAWGPVLLVFGIVAVFSLVCIYAFNSRFNKSLD